eukprot:gene5963-7426_t
MDIFDPLTPSIVDDINEVYQNNIEQQQHRYQELESKFRELFNGDKPSFYFRAPGRVNLIGEHVDYSGYPVLPFALEQDTIVAVSINHESNDHINIYNYQSEKFTPKLNINIRKSIDIDLSNHHWTNYVLAAWKGVQNSSKNLKLKSLNLLYYGNVPIGSGVSSSSSLVCVSTLAFSYINNLIYTKDELADLSVKSERFVGIEGGGMDQAISFLAEENTAKLIEFGPLKTFNVNLPKNVTFIISNSLVESNKVVTGGIYYNLRVVECRLAAVVLAFRLGLKWEEVRRLIDVQNQSTLLLSELIEKVKEILHVEPYTKAEVADILGLSVETLEKRYFPSGITVTAERFELYKRALHVYSETKRVYQFSDKCKLGGANISEELGQLMNQSHTSCDQLFNCSCPELNQLTKICLDSGALGSRLTGAGWGGCVISLVPTNAVEQFKQQIQSEYYEKCIDPLKLPSHQNSYFFSTNPSKGASILPSSILRLNNN